MIEPVHRVRQAHCSPSSQAPMIEKKVSILLLEIFSKPMVVDWLGSYWSNYNASFRKAKFFILWLFVNGMGPPNAKELCPWSSYFWTGLEWSTSYREIEILHFTASRFLTFKFNGSTCQIFVSKGHVDIIDFLPTN